MVSQVFEGLFGNGKPQDPTTLFIGPNGQSKLGVNCGNMTFVDGQTYTHLGGGVTMGPNGQTFVQMGSALMGPNGSSHLVAGDDPTFII